MKRILVVLLTALILSGCGSKSASKTIECTPNFAKSPTEPSKVVVFDKDNKLERLELTMSLDTPSKKERDDAIPLIKEYYESFFTDENVHGIDLNPVGEKGLDVVLKIDATKDVEALENFYDIKEESLTLDTIVKDIEAKDYTCK